MSLSPEDYAAKREIPPELMREARQATEEKVRAYELKQARKACSMTQSEIAREMGVSQKRISDLENGQIGVVQVDTLRRYVAGLGGTLEVRAVLPHATIRIA
ncbi:helix-turn-helix domain-containing protein [Adlercreutzia sp. ZJ473]|uniref:helix-turn-helix domain-containing protein n=1 Tax=Adlercreutzia sp. ZJ473 TaxID=2722822 RepID=UPI001551F40C|nr:helix-turn-helix domain-containing protein [Adlercreutzia sp. ZJ473]